MAGLTEAEHEAELRDIQLMRIAVRLSAADLHPLTAGLLGNAKSTIHRIECDFPELRFCDRAFLILMEWKKMLWDQVRLSSAQEMVRVFEDMKGNMPSNKHTVCMVCC